MSRLDSRKFKWFVICAEPQRELAVQKIMDGEGFATFVPVAIEPKFANAAARARMEKTEIALPIMPRYVFLGMKRGLTPGWERVFCFTQLFGPRRNDTGGLDRLSEPALFRRRRVITGVLGLNGRPCEVRHDTVKGKNGEPDMPGLRAFMLRHNKGEFNAPGYHKKMRQTGREFGPGDMVTNEWGSITFKVIDIADGKVDGFIEMFGKTHKVKLRIEDLFLVE